VLRFAVLLQICQATAFGFQVPPGFAVERVVATNHCEFPMFGAFDNKGRLFVAESSGLDLYVEISALTRKCRVRVLEDKDGDGKFEASKVFTDKLVYPMGLVWGHGKLYVADPPNLITVEDTNQDGVGDKRTMILSEFGHKDNGSLHGLMFGPDGWLYMTTGSPDGYRFKRADGSVLEGESGALIRCRPDGSDVEVLARGFENLIEVVFMPDWEIVGTLNWYQWPERGVRDALVHLLPGGLYPMHKEVGTPQPITGDPLPAIALYPAVALSGLTRYEGATFPAAMRDNLFSAQHNSRKVQRHVLIRQGSTFRVEDHDFLTTDDPDFHPSDVLEAPDGSLLVLDTGSWYTQHCPTGKIRNSQSRGGIFRISHKSSERGQFVRASTSRAALARMGRLSNTELVELLDAGAPYEQLAAAEALAQSGSAKQLPALWNALRRNPDRMLEHVIIYALHRRVSTDDLRTHLNDPEPRVQAAALLLLDQPPRLTADLVLDRALSTNALVRKAAMIVLKRHPEWSNQLQQRPHFKSVLLELRKDEGFRTREALVGEMPNAELPTDAQQKLAAWERLLGKGNPERGRRVFVSPKTACVTCHAVGPDGGKAGPDLTKLGAIRSGRDILESILFPSSTLAQGYQSLTVSTKEDDDLQGIIVRETEDAIVLRDATGAETRIERKEIREMHPSAVSLMPSGLEQALTREEFADLLAYLQSLR
jgi:putative heme-binding domain-containing protein